MNHTFRGDNCQNCICIWKGIYSEGNNLLSLRAKWIPCRILHVRWYNVVFTHQVCCKNKQWHAILSKKLVEVFSTMANTREILKETNDFSLILNWIRSALVCELLRNNLLFGGQLQVEKTLALHVCALIYFTTDLQRVNYFPTIHGWADLFLKYKWRYAGNATFMKHSPP